VEKGKRPHRRRVVVRADEEVERMRVILCNSVSIARAMALLRCGDVCVCVMLSEGSEREDRLDYVS
jgi:hypothetical protein